MSLSLPSQRVAIFFDGDQTQLSFIPQILEISQRYGSIVRCRAYGNWQQFSAQHKTLRNFRDFNIELIQQDPGKNATDHRLMIQALRILDANEADIFIIVSSDEDFFVLCQEIQQQKKQVIGIGSKKITTKELPSMYSKFHYLEDLENELKKLQKAQPAKKLENLQKTQPVVSTTLDEFEMFVADVLSKLPHKDGWACYEQLLTKLRELAPGFESKLGGKRLFTWLKGLKRFECRQHLIRMI